MSDRHFDELATRFAEKIYGGAKGAIRLAVLQADLAEALPERPLRVLDIGAGLGHMSLWLAARVQVSAFLRNELRTRQVTDYYGGYYGNYGGWRDPWYGYGASYPVTRSYTVQVTVVRVELNDARSGQPVWGNSAEFDSGDSASEQAKALREAVKRALSSYPPG
ncbi:hypothetical protein Z046_27125 [Pseudomonas aeruginosa VRFPA09]|nr:hypothetical protein Z046_27125 [Pseudomonas aeruginosa VRFPA09]